MSQKKLTRIELYDRDKSYKGRLLGLVNDKEFHALLTRKRVQNKVFSGQTVPLSEIVSNYRAGFDGMRLVLAVREIDDKPVTGKHLFITERLDYVGTEQEEIGILGKENEYYALKEEAN